jgi:glutathione S-transferase
MDLALHYLSFSPWSQKARRVLQHHRLSVREHAYTPIVGELALRMRLRKPRGRVTVPVLFTPEGALTDSWDIALYADRIGAQSALIPSDKQAEIRNWNEASERLLSAGRGCTMLRTLQAPEAGLEALPKPLARLLGVRGGTLAVRAFNAKYDIHEGQLSHYRDVAREELSRLRRALAGGRRYLLDQLSYADIAMAVGLVMLRPPANSSMGPAMRRAAIDESLAAEYPDLIAWRDSIHAQEPW